MKPLLIQPDFSEQLFLRQAFSLSSNLSPFTSDIYMLTNFLRKVSKVVSEIECFRQSSRFETTASSSRKILMISSAENRSFMGGLHVTDKHILNIAAC
ncbi:hypothetical protein T296_22835 [Pantoea agglomerans Eh318]|nr:hypothetical protein T296_22835 [Pantoea agglomerans Eh318]